MAPRADSNEVPCNHLLNLIKINEVFPFSMHLSIHLINKYLLGKLIRYKDISVNKIHP